MKPAARRPRTTSVRIPAGEVTLGANREAIAFGWDNEFDRHPVHVPAFEIDVHNVTNADLLAFVEAGGYTNRELWTEADWEWLQSEGLRHPMFWVRNGKDLFWHGMFEDLPVAARLARLRQPRRSLRLRAMAGAPPADRGRVPSSGVRHARR